ncbi:glycosyltransferase WbuB [Vibrio lentus]|uniref:glycosyltransferase family 4 protein n=1 Tax=Vibrio lentus TaxID=136468 RepID=UPI000C824F51|nr:glycosyltransferase family 4 protein [Vibrio lentus]PMH28911.1 glycosyltransferase WbuB [Vibrio lentus]PMK68426.1 glycosyltransferase WbuB [Vibrio lentus]
MRLALVIDDYLPNSTRVGAKMFHELAKQLLMLGHQVTVIVPDSQRTSSLVIDEIDGVKVWRFSCGQLKDIGRIKRAIRETFLSKRAWEAVSSQIEPDTFDGVIYYSPSIFFGSLVRKIKKRCNCSSYLVLRDLFPQWVIDSGLIKRGSFIEKYFRFFENLSYSQANMIGVMSKKNQQVFNDMTHNQYPSQVLRNWASLEPYHPSLDEVKRFRTRYKLENKVVYFYGGNIGHAQDMVNLMRLVRTMSKHTDAHFLFVGQGDEVSLINALANKWNLHNFTYLPSVNQDEFKKILASTDVGLFSLASNHMAHNFPGKILGYMVQSIPILGSVNQGNDLLDLMNENESGLITVNGEDDQLYKNAIRLLDKGERDLLGSNAYKLLTDEFSVENIANIILPNFK